jgi:hypothetical protein
MSDIVGRINALADQIAAEGMSLRAADVRAGAVEIGRLQKEWQRLQRVLTKWSDANIALEADNERLLAVLQALHDWYVEYARINNLFNADGSPATFHELLEARRALEDKP